MVAISRTSESAQRLETQLDYAHSQIISVLTGSIVRVLEEKPGYDIRNLMGGYEARRRSDSSFERVVSHAPSFPGRRIY